jgi:Tol biopolymer transport system component
MFRLKLSLRFIAVAILVGVGIAAAQTKSTRPLTIENLIDIKHPSNPVWSPDCKRVAFLWDRADIVNLYVTNADGGGAPVALTAFPDGKVNDIFWSKDGTSVYFARGGDLWQIAATGGEPQAVWTTPSPEVEFSPSPDGAKLAFVRAGSAGEAQHGGDLIVRALSDGSESKIAHDDESIYSPLWSPDGSQLA